MFKTNRIEYLFSYKYGWRSTNRAFEMTPCGRSGNFGRANISRNFFMVGAIFERALVASVFTFAICFLRACFFLSSPEEGERLRLHRFFFRSVLDDDDHDDAARFDAFFLEAPLRPFGSPFLALRFSLPVLPLFFFLLVHAGRILVGQFLCRRLGGALVVLGVLLLVRSLLALISCVVLGISYVGGIGNVTCRIFEEVGGALGNGR